MHADAGCTQKWHKEGTNVMAAACEIQSQRGAQWKWLMLPKTHESLDLYNWRFEWLQFQQRRLRRFHISVWHLVFIGSVVLTEACMQAYELSGVTLG